MKRALATLLVIVGILSISSCQPIRSPESQGPKELSYAPYTVVFWQPVPDERVAILCIYADGNGGGGLSCDWAGAGKTTSPESSG